MGTLAYNRLRSRRYVRCRARGLSREVACKAADYHVGGASRIERRLKAEIAQEKRKLAGRLGYVPSTFGRTDAAKLLRAELERVAYYFGPRAKDLEAQTLRDLARQIKQQDAEEHLRRIETRLSREAKSGGPITRTLKVRELTRQLIYLIRKRKDAPVYPDLHAPLETANADAGPRIGARPAAHEPASPQCPKHAGQPVHACSICAALRALDPTRGLRDDVFTEAALPEWIRRQGGTY